jgi:hypothetical protein
MFAPGSLCPPFPDQMVPASCQGQQAYPARPVRIIVAAPAAGPTDIAARLIGQSLSERLGRLFPIENRPGGNNNIGTETVVRAPATPRKQRIGRQQIKMPPNPSDRVAGRGSDDVGAGEAEGTSGACCRNGRAHRRNSHRVRSGYRTRRPAWCRCWCERRISGAWARRRLRGWRCGRVTGGVVGGVGGMLGVREQEYPYAVAVHDRRHRSHRRHHHES